MFPRNKDILLHNYSIAIKIRKFTSIYYYPLILRPQSSFYIFLNKVLYSKRSSSESCVAFSDFSLVSFNLGQFLSLSFVIVILRKNTRQLFCRLSLNLGLSDVSSWLGSGHASLVGLSQKGCCVLLIASYPECTCCQFILFRDLGWTVYGNSSQYHTSKWKNSKLKKIPTLQHRISISELV